MQQPCHRGWNAASDSSGRSASALAWCGSTSARHPVCGIGSLPHCVVCRRCLRTIPRPRITSPRQRKSQPVRQNSRPSGLARCLLGVREGAQRKNGRNRGHGGHQSERARTIRRGAGMRMLAVLAIGGWAAFLVSAGALLWIAFSQGRQNVVTEEPRGAPSLLVPPIIMAEPGAATPLPIQVGPARGASISRGCSWEMTRTSWREE